MTKRKRVGLATVWVHVRVLGRLSGKRMLGPQGRGAESGAGERKGDERAPPRATSAIPHPCRRLAGSTEEKGQEQAATEPEVLTL